VWAGKHPPLFYDFFLRLIVSFQDMRAWLASWNKAQESLEKIQRKLPSHTTSNLKSPKPSIGKSCANLAYAAQVGKESVRRPDPSTTKPTRPTTAPVKRCWEPPRKKPASGKRLADGRSPQMSSRAGRAAKSTSAVTSSRRPVHVPEPPQIDAEIDTSYETLPGSPKWERAGFSNEDCQPDLEFCREKRWAFQVRCHCI
jgi:hypothetical protein